MATNGYAHPEALVSTEWVAQHLNDPNVRIIEVDPDTTAYAQAHIPGAVGWNWETELQDQLRRTLAGKEQFEALCSRAGISPETTVIVYGDNNNWFAAWAFWEFKIYGHKDVRLMNGGRKKWIEEGRPTTIEVKEYPRTQYRAQEPDWSLRAKRDLVTQIVERGGTNLVDVRSPDEFTGKVIAPPGLNETAQRGGHIPGAVNIPWAMSCNEDGTFKTPDELKALYEGRGVKASQDTVAYCRIGERSSLTWFVLKYLLGYPNVKNYDGSWTEWGNLIDAPIEK
jgi:thiosulfate/3-mercaptopyruvate sulfurtransferase